MKRYPALQMADCPVAAQDWWKQVGDDVARPGHDLSALPLPGRSGPARRTVYFNMDDYSQYWPRAADRVKALGQAVREADLTVCVSRPGRGGLRPRSLRRPTGSATCRTAAPTVVARRTSRWHRPAPPPVARAAPARSWVTSGRWRTGSTGPR